MKPYSLLCLFFFCQTVFAQTQPAGFDADIALTEELKYLKAEAEATNYISIASRFPQTTNAAPAILTVVTEKEILNSGARDLVDVLRLVPGFDFGAHLSNISGTMIRGNFAEEGGIALLIDGLEMNERISGTVQLGQYYPIDNIQRIEVMRGPGSVMYGGFARLGVINIITKGFKNSNFYQHQTQKNTAKEKDEVAITARYGQMAKTYGHRGISFYAGKNLTDNARVTVSAKASQSNRSDKNYISASGETIALANVNKMEDLLFNVGFQYGNDLVMRFIFKDYANWSTDIGSLTHIPPSVSNFKSHQFDAKYKHDFSDNLRLSFNFNYSHQTPWDYDEFIDNAYNGFHYVTTTRYTGSARVDYAVNEAIHITNGLEFTHEEFETTKQKYNVYPNLPEVLPIYENFTPYIEGLFKSDWGNLTLGLRYDKHNKFESNFAPRAAFTGEFGDFHYKLLYNNSFKTPTITTQLYSDMHILKPERTVSYEAEFSYQLTKTLSFATNAYYLSTKDKIVYGYDGVASLYQNAHKKIQSVGVESELRWKQDWGYVTFNHSYTQMLNNFKDYQPINQITGQLVNSDLALAFPAHKFTLNGHYEITPALSINPSLILTSSRYGYDTFDAQGNLTLRKYSPEVLGNLYFRYQNVLFKGLELGVGAYNIFNSNQRFVQPYNSAHPPLPGQSREFIFKISYQL